MSSSGSSESQGVGDAESFNESEGEWTEEPDGADEGGGGAVGDVEMKVDGHQKLPAREREQRSGARRAPRPPKHRRLKKMETDEDFKRFDRPDMFRNDVFPMLGMNLVPDKDGTKAKGISGYKLPPHCKVLRLSVDGGVPAGGRELFERIQAETLKKKHMPDTLNIHGKKFDLAYRCPDGDELSFGAHSQDIQWIGDRYLGSVFISHHQKPVATHTDELGAKAAAEAAASQPSTPAPEKLERPAWHNHWTNPSWHKVSPYGTDDTPPPPLVIKHGPTTTP